VPKTLVILSEDIDMTRACKKSLTKNSNVVIEMPFLDLPTWSTLYA